MDYLIFHLKMLDWKYQAWVSISEENKRLPESISKHPQHPRAAKFWQKFDKFPIALYTVKMIHGSGMERKMIVVAF